MTINAKTKLSFLSLVVGCLSLAGASVAFASPISTDPIDRHAWNDVVGWIDFGGSGAVDVSSDKLTGYANILQAGPLALDCSTTPTGPKCSADGGFDWGVANDGEGVLSGWAWNDNFGWVSFSGIAGDGSLYGVIINGSSGDFSGWAWNDIIGWISFNCTNILGTCSTSDYTVNTSWRTGPDIDPPTGGPKGGTSGGSGGGIGSDFDADTWLTSSVFDTQVQGGAALNTVMWLGVQPPGTSVGIQIASSNDPDGPWEDANFLGPDGKSTSAYEADQGLQFRLNPSDHNNKRYFRYKVYLSWTEGGDTPIVNDIIISYSP